MITILDRYIFRELLSPFWVSLAVLCGLVWTKEMLRLVELLVGKGMGLLAVARIIIHLMPSFLVLTLPMACLIASIAAFSRLSRDSEIVAMRTAGLSLIRITAPVLVFSSFVFLGTLGLSQWGQPWSSLSLKKLAISLIQDQFQVALEHGAFQEPVDGMMMFVPEPEPGEPVRGIFISDRRDPDSPLIMTATSFQRLNDPSHRHFGIRLRNGAIHRTPADDAQYHHVSFTVYDIKMDLSSALNVTTPTRPDYQHILAALEQSGWQDNGMLRRLMEYYKDLAFPAATLILGILGVPVGILSKQSGHTGGFVLGLVIMVGYYLLNVLGEFGVTTRMFHPFAGAWFPNVCLLLLTGLLCHRASRR